MISEAVSLVADHLNSYCARHFDLDDEIVVLSSIQDVGHQNGALNQNKILISLINIEKDAAYLNRQNLPGASQASIQQSFPLRFNLYIVLAANYENDRYQQGLKILSACIQFLNSYPVFDQRNSPNMSAGLDKLTLEIENLSLSELNSLWGMMGRHYLPSILYKIRMITIDSNTPIERISNVSAPDSEMGGR